MSTDRRCAAPGCDEPVVQIVARGRPPIYCSPACRPSHMTSTSRGHARISIEVEPDDARLDDPDTARTFVVRVRRGKRSVVVAHGVGRFSAAALADDLRGLFGTITRQEGGTTN